MRNRYFYLDRAVGTLVLLVGELERESAAEHYRDTHDPCWCDGCGQALATGVATCPDCGEGTYGALDADDRAALTLLDDRLQALKDALDMLLSAAPEAVRAIQMAELWQQRYARLWTELATLRKPDTDLEAKLVDLAERLRKERTEAEDEGVALGKAARKALARALELRRAHDYQHEGQVQGIVQMLMEGLTAPARRGQPHLDSAAKAAELWPELQEAINGRDLRDVTYGLDPRKRFNLCMNALGQAAHDLGEARQELLDIERLLRPLWAEAHRLPDGSAPKETPPLLDVVEWAAEHVVLPRPCPTPEACEAGQTCCGGCKGREREV